jgi:DNA-directed RNA polymerase subunit RPC12/RpoP
MSQHSFSGDGTQMLGENMGKQSYKCPNCRRQYLHKGNLKQHLKYECGKEPQWQCPYCPKRTKLKGNLKQHIVLVHETPSARAQNGKGRYLFK